MVRSSASVEATRISGHGKGSLSTWQCLSRAAFTGSTEAQPTPFQLNKCDSQWQGDYVVLASEPVCICGVDVAAPQQLRARNSQHKMSMAELRSIFSRQFTEYEVKKTRHACYTSVRPLKGALSF